MRFGKFSINLKSRFCSKFSSTRTIDILSPKLCTSYFHSQHFSKFCFPLAEIDFQVQLSMYAVVQAACKYRVN